MTNHEQTQADLLDQFRQNRDGNPPAGLESGVAAMAVMLEDRLSPPAPSARFVQNLGRRLDVEANHSGNHRQTGTLPPLPDQTIPPSTPPNNPPTDSHDEPRRSWIFEAGRIAAAGLAIALVGTILMLVFRDADDAVAPGAGETTAHPGEILISWDPNGGEDYKLFVVDTDSGEARKLNYGSAESGGVFSDGPAEADGISERYASWSPDGQKIAFVREESDQSDIIVMNADGSDPVNVTSSPDNEHAPTWSPDGSQIAFNREGGEPAATNIYLMSADGSDVRQLTSYSSGAVYPDWSPDGSRIAFARVNGSTTQNSLNVWVMNADGSRAQPITELDILVGRPRWSPDGEHIAFVAGSQIWIVAPDGTGLHTVTDETGATSHPDWSADGQRLVYISGNFVDGSDGVGVVNVDGTILELWPSSTDIQDSPSWSPDGRQIAYFSGNDRDQGTESAFWDFNWELRVAGIDDSDEHNLITGGSIDVTWPPAWRPPTTKETPPSPPSAATPTPIAATGADRLYVVTSNGVTVIDPSTNDEIYSIDADSPDAALSPDGSQLYVLGAGGSDVLQAFDAADGHPVWRTVVEDRIRWIGDQGPSTLAVSPDGSRIYIASTDTPNIRWIQIFDAATGQRIDESEHIRGDCPPTLYPSRDGNNLYVVCGRGGDVRRIDLNTLAPQGGGGVVGTNVGSVMSPDGAYLYVVWNSSDGFEVMRLDTVEGEIAVFTNLEQADFPPVGGNPVTVSPDGARLFVGLGSDGDDENDPSVHEIAVIDTESWEEVDRITLDVAVERYAFTMSPDGQYIYASERLQSESDGKLIRIDVESGETSTVIVRNAEILRVLTSTQRQSNAPAPIPPVDQEEGAPPPATLSFGDVSQIGEFAYGCMWAGDTVCVDPAGLRFPEEVMQVPAGSSLTFTVEGMTDLVNVQANAFLLNDDTNVEDLQGIPFLTYPPPPASRLPVSPSSTQPRFMADLPPGEYAIRVDARNSSSESGTYGFHIVVTDEATGHSTEPPPLTTWETREGESPLATWDPDDWDAYPQAASGQGTLDVSDDCARLVLSNQKVILLVWPEPTSWNPSSQAIEFAGVDGERIELRDGDQIIAGGITASGVGETQFVVPPQPSCQADEMFILHGVQLVTD